MKRDAPPSSAPGPTSGPAKGRSSPIFLVLADPRLFGSFPRAVKIVEEGAREALGIEPISIGVSGPEHLHRLREAVVEARRRGASLLIVVDEGSKLLPEVVKAADLTLEAASLIRARPAEGGRVEFRLLSSPGRAYSQGMLARLSVSLLLHLPRDVLLLDEVLGPGDREFRERCARRIRELADRGKGIVLVSHDLDVVREACTRAIWLDGGRIVMEGPPEEVIEVYQRRATARGGG